MRIILTDKDTIAEWLYPGSFRDLETIPEDCLTDTSINKSAFTSLWKAVDGSDLDALIDQSFSEVGIPHSAPDYVERINPDLVKELATIADHDRWRVAEKWATVVAGRRPNKQTLDKYKRILKATCDFAARAEADQRMLVLLDD